MTLPPILRGLLVAAVLLLICQPAFAGKRVALVVGDSAYQNVPPLRNPANDAAMMEMTFRQAGFDVVDARHDLSAQETRQALRQFADSAQDADIAVIYKHVDEMQLIPFDKKAVIVLLVATLVPMIPLLGTVIGLTEILSMLAKFLV